MEAKRREFECFFHLDHAQKKIYEFLDCSKANKKNLLAQLEIPAPISTKEPESFENL